MTRRAALLATCLLASCVEQRAQTPWLVDAPAVIAVLAKPPEAEPGAEVSYEAVIATPDGPADTSLSWSFCRTPRPLTENGPVAETCARESEVPLPFTSSSITTQLPRDACARFGPETSAGLRPPDPDATGGYYQPLRIALEGGGVAVFRQRLSCALPDAPLLIAQEFAQRYRANRTPGARALSLQVAGREVDPDALPAGEQIEITAELDPDAREGYVRYERASGKIVEADEVLSATWYATRGQLAVAQQRLSTDHAPNHFRLEAEDGDAWIWLVLRDDRGGASIQNLHVAIAR